MRRGHGHWVHLRSSGVHVRERRAARCLVRRVRERHLSALVRAVELRTHVGTTARLVGSRSEGGARRVGHLRLVARLRVSATTAALMRVATTSGARAHVVAHVAVGRLGGFTTEVLRTGTERSLWSWAHLCKQQVKTWGSRDEILRGRVPYTARDAPPHASLSLDEKRQHKTGVATYVVITSLSKAAKVGHVPCLIGRRWWAAAA